MVLPRIPSNQVYRSMRIQYPLIKTVGYSAILKSTMFAAFAQACKSAHDSNDTGPYIDTERDTQPLSHRGSYGDSHSHCLAASID